VAATAERTTIATTGLTKRYGDIVALDDVTVELGDVAIGLLGANGAGKSTLMRALLGLVKPDAGSALLLGIDAAGRGLELRRRIGYMPEHECLPSWMTARDLVVHLGELRGLPRRIAVLRTSEVLFQVGLEEERLRLIGTFSTGMRQRVKLAQALVHSPELVVLDEPTNGLDPQGREEMLELVRRLSRDLGIRVLFSSHVLEDVERTCDAVIVLRDGLVAAQGRISDLLGRDAGTARLNALGDLAALRAAMEARGLEVEAGEEGWLAVRGDAATLSAAIRDACAEADVSLRALLPGDRTLEDAVIGAIA
jgi:ABC-2 type transport system ATP-binding protein